MLARAIQYNLPETANRLIWFKIYLLGFLVIPTGFLILTMHYAGLGYMFTPRIKFFIYIFPTITGILILTNERHGWMWAPEQTPVFLNNMEALSPNTAHFWYWLFVGHSYVLMGLGCFLLYGVRARSLTTSRWKTYLIITGTFLASFGPLLDIFRLSPFPPFFASFAGIILGGVIMYFNISPVRKRDLLYVTRGAIINNMSDPILVMDADNHLIDLNPAAEILLGSKAGDLMGKTIHILFPEFRTMWENQSQTSGEIILTHIKKPLTFDYRISVIRDWQGQMISKMMVLRDITARKQADAELRMFRDAERSFSQHLTKLIQVTQTLSISSSLDELCRQAVEMGRNILGFDRLAIWFITEDMEYMLGTFGTSIEGHTTDERGARHPISPDTHLKEILTGKVEMLVREDAPLYQADGQEVGRGARISAGLWDGTHVVGFLSVDNHRRHLPFSEYDKEIIRLYAFALGHLCTLKKAEEEVRQLTETLEHRVAARTQELDTANIVLEAFAFSFSHDLRAPIRAIDGYTTLLVENHGSDLDAEGQRLANVTQREARRMGRLIDDLLTFSRFSRTELRKTNVDMNVLVKSALQELLPTDEMPQVEIKIDPLAPAWGDYALLQQVWTNLLSNALKFTSKEPQAIIHLHSTLDETHIKYCIRDNGVGFDMAYAHKLFGVFQRLHGEKEFPGTGAGLAIVQRIILRHGGHIWAESEEGVGTAFFFTLPRGD